MRYLLDTNVVSALRVRGHNRSVEAWAASVPVGDQFVSALTVAEIERGVIARERSDSQQGAILRRWFDDHVLPAFGSRAQPVGHKVGAQALTPGSGTGEQSAILFGRRCRCGHHLSRAC